MKAKETHCVRWESIRDFSSGQTRIYFRSTGGATRNLIMYVQIDDVDVACSSHGGDRSMNNFNWQICG
jgi:hypothetical protein